MGGIGMLVGVGCTDGTEVGVAVEAISGVVTLAEYALGAIVGELAAGHTGVGVLCDRLLKAITNTRPAIPRPMTAAMPTIMPTVVIDVRDDTPGDVPVTGPVGGDSTWRISAADW